MSSCTHCCESSEDRSGVLTDKYKEGIDHGSMMLPSRKNPETHPGISICVTMAGSYSGSLRPESSVQLSSAEGADQGLSLSLALPTKARILCIDSL
jgi:hypothetical protein